MVSIVIFILILSLIVLVHELGHYAAARWAGIKVDEFGLGYPPRALKLFTRWGTVFSLNWIPFGGFVKMEGEEPPENDAAEKKAAAAARAGQAPFYAVPVWKRIIVILAGVTANFALGVILFAIVFSRIGIPTPIESARIGAVVPDSPAAQAGLPTDVDIIAVQLAGEAEPIAVTTPDDIIAIVGDHRGETLTLITTGHCDASGCQESAQSFDVYARTEAETPENEGSLGIGFVNSTLQFYPWYEMPLRSAWFGLEQTLFLIALTVQGLGRVITELLVGVIPQDVAGPIGIVHQAQESGIFEEGWLALLNFTALISVSIGVMNLLPIPVFDGGRAVFLLLEPLVGRSRIRRIEGYANYGGMLLVIGLIIAITALDISRIVRPG